MASRGTPPPPARQRQARLYQAILVAWLYNFGVAVSALQQQYIFHELFSEDGSAVATPTSALLYGYKKACDYFFTFLTVGWCGSLSSRIGRRPLAALVLLSPVAWGPAGYASREAGALPPPAARPAACLSGADRSRTASAADH